MRTCLLPLRLTVLATVAALALAACGDSSGVASRSTTPETPVDPTPVNPRTFLITPGPTATQQMLDASVSAVPGDTIQFDCGFFDLTQPMQLANTENIVIKGCGKDLSFLSFKNSNQPIGIGAVNVRGLTVEDLTVLDTDGNGIELRGVDHGTIRRVRTFWTSNGGNESPTPTTKDNYTEVNYSPACTDPATQNPAVPENAGGDISSPDYTVSDKAGRYGIYPVSSSNILVEETESIGASDAGIYVGQTNNAIIRRSRAAFNVFGFEIENVQGGEYNDNVAECNTGGFLIYDLDGNLRQYGDRTRMYRNLSRLNNTYNFTEGGFVANVPPGSGMITLSYDRIDVFENEFRDNNTGGIIHASYELFPEGAGRPTEKRIDFYTEGMHIFKNRFFNNGNDLPEPTSTDIQEQDLARLLPAIVGSKNQAACSQPQNAAACAAAGGSGQAATGYRGAHIVWDGLLDVVDNDCEYPTKPNGEPVPMDERGKPQHTNQEDPTCHYNKYKFKADGSRIVPDWFASCIDDDNVYSADSLKFSNFHGTKGVDAAIAIASGQPPTPQQLQDFQQFPASFDVSPHQCVARYGKNMALLPAVVIPPFVPSSGTDAAPTQAEIDRLCNAVVPAGKINFDAARVNCPRLDQYNLFSNPEDPTSAPNRASTTADYGDSEVKDGVPFVLNTKLFSDYSVKYRVLFLPLGGKAIYKDASTDGANATIIYPVGTIIAKTFAFADTTAGTEVAAETRLLIKRVNNATKQARWDPLEYIWTTENGKRVAKLSPTGGTRSVSWNYNDIDSGVKHTGSTDYKFPTHTECMSCHSREDSEPGAAPIGTKVRNLNRPYKSESSKATGQSGHESAGKNQIAYLCQNGLMLGCPSDLGLNTTTQIASNLERLPAFNKPGDGHATDTAADIEARARAYLEVNCQHCHNVKGLAGSTGLYLNTSGPVGLAHGVCKKPTATGAEGSGGRIYDIVPTDPTRSILEFRLSPSATSAAARMPPLARSVVDTEGHALITQWIRDVVKVDTAKYPNSDSCN